jgi:hypothetical protein
MGARYTAANIPASPGTVRLTRDGAAEGAGSGIPVLRGTLTVLEGNVILRDPATGNATVTYAARVRAVFTVSTTGVIAQVGATSITSAIGSTALTPSWSTDAANGQIYPAVVNPPMGSEAIASALFEMAYQQQQPPSGS